MNRLALSALLAAAALLSLPAFAQAPAPAAGCGNPATQFDVETDRGLHPSPLAPNKALVFFLEDDSNISGFRNPTVRVGVDGKWVGAAHGTSYFFFYLQPGAHHLCTDWQDADVFSRKTSTVRTLDFTVEPGKTYYFQVTNTFRGASRTSTTLEPVTTTNQEDLLGDYDFAYFHQLP